MSLSLPVQKAKSTKVNKTDLTFNSLWKNLPLLKHFEKVKAFLKRIKIKASSYLHIEEVSKDQYLIAENFPVCQWNNPLVCWQIFDLQTVLQFEDSSSIWRHSFNLHVAFPFANSSISNLQTFFFDLQINLQSENRSSICR